jgi:ABC-type branched-subunit amino acid transport system ATPase component
MFDEPTAGMNARRGAGHPEPDPPTEERQTKTILLVEHKMDVVRELADRIIVLHNGTLVADGDPATVIASPVVQEAYLERPARCGGQAKETTTATPGAQPAKVAHAHTDAHPALLRLSGVHTHIGAYHILHGVDLAVPRGQLTMLLGRNGAGKTTTLRTIMGLWQASQGSRGVQRQDITRLNTPQIAGLNIAYVPENMGIFADLTVKENMLLAARRPRMRADGRSPPEVDLSTVPGGGKILEPPGGQAVGRAKADAGGVARHCGAARFADHRRAQQGPGPVPSSTT